MAVQAMKEGAFEFIQKPFAIRICSIASTRAEAGCREPQHSGTAHRSSTPPRIVDARERQVMDMVVDGAANKVIAIDLN